MREERVGHHRLANGLQVLTLVDRTAPILAYQTWFQVGSRHEREGTTGMAHLFEHLMFNQTTSLAPGEFDRLIERTGGETNAATSVDRTYYANKLPSNELALAVRLESDRMANLVLGDEQVESEREVVANERRFRVEDDVDGFLSEELFRMAFTDHPYRWPTIGWMKDIMAIQIADCRAFYETFYGPNNALIVLAGDFDETAALRLIEEHYGAIRPRALPIESEIPIEPEQQEERRATWKKPVGGDRLKIGYKSPAFAHPDYAVFELLSEILFGGQSSRLDRLLVVEKELAFSVDAWLSPFKDPSLFEISVSVRRGHGAAEVESLIYPELERLATVLTAPEELIAAKARLETCLYTELRPVFGQAEALGNFHSAAGDYRRLFAVGRELRKITGEDVLRVARSYFDSRRRTVVIAHPASRTR